MLLYFRCYHFMHLSQQGLDLSYLGNHDRMWFSAKAFHRQRCDNLMPAVRKESQAVRGSRKLDNWESHSIRQKEKGFLGVFSAFWTPSTGKWTLYLHRCHWSSELSWGLREGWGPLLGCRFLYSHYLNSRWRSLILFQEKMACSKRR